MIDPFATSPFQNRARRVEHTSVSLGCLGPDTDGRTDVVWCVATVRSDPAKELAP